MESLDGRYELVRPLGAGGMGEVFVARRVALGDLVAIKRLLPAQDTPDNRARFLGEARAAAHIHHPNVVRVFDFGEPEGAPPYLVMEYLDGPTLADELAARGRLGADEALALFAPICAAVEAGHRRGVVHRDLKPANVILARADDDTRVVKVLDFGLAVMDSAPNQRLTSPGTIVGTCSYMAPEQVAGLPAMPATDVFALGVILYELLTGVLPFEAETQMAVLFKISQGVFRPASELVPGLPRALDDALASALAVDPSRRVSRPEQLLALAGVDRTSTTGVRAVVERGPASGSEPTQVMTPSGTAPVSTRTGRAAAAAPRLDVFVGRVAELARLDDAHREAQAGRARIVVVVGDDGAGRSRLAETFGRRAGAAGAAVFTARLFVDAPRPLDAFARMLAGSVTRPGVETPRLDDPGEVARAVGVRAAGRPPVVIVDDLHLASAADLEAIEPLPRAGVLVIATASAAALRRDPQTPAARWLAAQVARRTAVTEKLRRFGLVEVRAYLDAVFGAVHARPRDLRRLDAWAGGNPGFLAEAVRHLVAANAIRRRDDEWVIEVPEDVEVPATVTALIEAQLVGLDAELVSLIELAAAAGDDVRFDVVAAASGLDEERVDALLERAVAEGVLDRDAVAPGADYRFASALGRAALYRRASPRARRRAHRRLLDAQVARPGGDPGRDAAARAAHHAALDEIAAAFAQAVIALDAALGSADADLAESALSRARDAVSRLDAAGTPPPDRERARLDYLGGALSVRIGRMGEARALLTRAGEAAADDPQLALDVRLELAQCQVALGDLDGAIAGASAVVAAARALGDRVREARGAVTGAVAMLRRGRHAESNAAADAVLADPSLPPALRAMAHRCRAWTAVAQGQFAAALIDAERGLALARGCGDPTVLWSAINARTAVAAESGDAEAARAFHEESLELARRASLRRCEAITLANLGEAHFDLGDHERALACFREALSIFLDIEDRACEGDCRVNVGRALLALGDRAAAVAMLERGRELCDACGRGEYAALALLHLGEARLGQGDAAAARTVIADARQRLDALRSHHLWRAELALAQAALLDGDRERARYHARRAADHVDEQRAHVTAGSLPAFDRLTAPVREMLAEL